MSVEKQVWLLKSKIVCWKACIDVPIRQLTDKLDCWPQLTIQHSSNWTSTSQLQKLIVHWYTYASWLILVSWATWMHCLAKDILRVYARTPASRTLNMCWYLHFDVTHLGCLLLGAVLAMLLWRRHICISSAHIPDLWTSKPVGCTVSNAGTCIYENSASVGMPRWQL